MKNTLVILWRSQIDQHRGVDRVIMKRAALFRVMSSADWTLFGTADRRRHDQVEAQLARLHSLGVVISRRWQRVITALGCGFLVPFAATTDIYLLKPLGCLIRSCTQVAVS